VRGFSIVVLSLLSMAVGAADLSSGSAEFRQQAGQYFFRANNADLKAALHGIESQTDLRIHYSVLPVATISATCVADSIQQLLHCLLDGKVDMAVRETQGRNTTSALEVWLLGSSITGVDTRCTSGEGHTVSEPSASAFSKEGDEPSAEQKLEFRKQMAVSGTPDQRTQAFSYLASNADSDDRDVRHIFEAAIAEDNVEVKSQALAALIRWEGEQQASAQLQQALHDPEVSVRLMALQHIDESTALIQQMLQDEDETVRQFAAMKLQNR